ncbi:uncharacterized protein EMH_0043020 [Eimeria mitis]|uniref:SUN domain-containing protein n=1 Tax=Eimeria mitis TaxID=44415 RepID=U6K5A4_9EIME|nr:uncharacterized protein EMH_0043020 [Eimeria mitis]CDJ32196.1 hypothetical protein, conserved [Eimeria mitis]
MACCAAAAEHSCSSCRSSPGIRSCVSRLVLLLLLLTFVFGVTAHAAAEGGLPAAISLAQKQRQELPQQQKPKQKEQQPQRQDQKQQYQLQQRACAAAPLKVFDLEGVSEGASGKEGGLPVPLSPAAILGTGSSPLDGGKKVQRQPDSATPPAASESSESREPQHQQDTIGRAAKDTAFATTSPTPRSSVEQQTHLQEEQLQRQKQQQQQRSQRPHVGSKTSGVFIAFKQLAAAAAAGAAVATRKRSGASRSGLQSSTQRQQQKQHQWESPPQQPSVASLSRISPPSDASEHRRATWADADRTPDVAPAAAAAPAHSAAVKLLATRESPTGAAHPIGTSTAVGLRRLLKAGQWQEQADEALPSAVCSWGSSTVWFMQWCYSLGSCTAAATRGGHVVTTALRGESASDAAAAATCPCVAPRMPVLLRDEPLRGQERVQQKQHEGITRAILVFQPQQVLLCCAEGSYPLQLGRALQKLQYSLSVAAAAYHEHVFAPEAAPASGKWHQLNGEKYGQNAVASKETTPSATREDIAEAESLKAAAAERAVAATGSSPNALAFDRAEQQQRELSPEADGEPDGKQKQGAKSDSKQYQATKEKHGRQQEQQPTNQQVDHQQQELSSVWGGQIVSWTWRRSCMRQRQLSKRESAEAAAVTAAALCYRPPAPTSLALQLLLLLLPHDLAVRLLADAKTAECKQPQQQQRSQQVQQAPWQQADPAQPENLFQHEDMKNHAVHREPRNGTCAAPVERLSSVNSCTVPFDDPSWPALQFAGRSGEAEQQQDAFNKLDAKEGVRFELQREEEQQQAQPSPQHLNQQQATQQEQTTNGPVQEGVELQDDSGYQQLQQRQYDAQPVAYPEHHSHLEHEQQKHEKLAEQIQQLDKNAAGSLAPAASASTKLHADSHGPSATSAVGGVPGAPQLYGRGFVQGEQLPASFLRLHFNFASLDAGARIIASSPGMQHIKAVQRPDADTYMLAPCDLPSKYFVLSFSETLKIDFVVMQSFEIYANAFWHIQLLGADTYPTGQWRLIANLQTAADVSSELFDLKSECAALSSCWAKFLKVRLLTHHDEGPHYYCSLTSFQVFGATGVQFLETQIHDEFGDTAQGAEGEVSEGAPSSSGLPAVGSPAVITASGGSSAGFAPKDSRQTGVEASPPLFGPDQPGSLAGIRQQLEAMQSVSVDAHGHQDSQQHEREHGTVAKTPQQLGEIQSGHVSAASVERLHNRNPVPKDAIASLEVDSLHRSTERTGTFDRAAEAHLLHSERQRRGLSAERHSGSPLDAPTDADALAAVSTDPETDVGGQRVTQQQQQWHNLLRVEDVETQGAAALNALSGALEKALQQQQLLRQKRHSQQQEHLDLQHDVLIDDPAWAEMGYSSVSIPGLREVLSFKGNLIDSTVCTASNSNNARSVWQGYNPLIQPTTSRYVCIPLGEGTPTAGAAAAVASASKPGAVHQGHLVSANSSPSKSGKQLEVAEAATEALRQAAAYARAFLLDALQHQQQQPQLQQSPINAAFLRFLMTTTPGDQDQQAETLRVLSLLLQPPAVDVNSNGGAVSGEATRGGMAATPPLGPRDTKGEHVLVMLLERMKSLEGETAAFKAAAAERQQQLQLQQQHLLHLALLVQLQQQLGSFLFERLSAFDGLIPHLNPLVQLLDESEAAATSAAAAAQEDERLHGTVPAAAEQHLDPHCNTFDGSSSGVNTSGQQKDHHHQQQHCRHTARHHIWGWPWDVLQQQVLQSLEWVWRWLALPLMQWGGDVIFATRVAAQLLQQLFCSDAESAVVQQSCAAASGLYHGVASVAGSVAYGVRVGADIVYRGISVVLALVVKTWTRLFAAGYQAPPPFSHDWSTGSSSSGGHWAERFLMLQERGSPQAVDSSLATPLLLLFVCFLTVSSAFFWRLRRGQRVAAAAAGECALLRRSFELLQQQHQALVHQLQQYKREQQLLLLLTASHHNGSSSRMLLHRTKYETYEADAQQRRRKEVQLDDAVKADLSSGIVRAAAAHQSTAFADAPEPFASPLTSQTQQEATPAPDTTSSLLRRLSTSLAPTVFLGLSRNAGDGPHIATADYGSSSNNSSNSSGDNGGASRTPGRGSDAVLPHRRETVAKQQESSCWPHEHQTQQEQQVQFAAATLLPALDTKAIRSLKLQRHTLRQRRQGGATTPVASPAAAAVPDGETPLLSPSVISARVSAHTQNAYISSGAEAAAITTYSAAPSRSSSSRSSSVCSASGNLHGVANSYLKSLWASQLARGGTIPHASLLLQSTQRQMESNRSIGPPERPEPEIRASSNPSSSSSSSSSACESCLSVAADVAAPQGPNVSCSMPVSVISKGRRVTGGELTDKFRTGTGALPLVHSEETFGAFVPDVTRCSESVGDKISIEANDGAGMAPASAVGPSTELQPEQMHLQTALASGTGRDGRRRRKKRGAA